MTAPRPDPLAVVDAAEAFADQLDAAVAVLARRGWPEDVARAMVASLVLHTLGAIRP